MRTFTMYLLTLALMTCSGCAATNPEMLTPPSYVLETNEQLPFRVDGVNFMFDNGFEIHNFDNNLSLLALGNYIFTTPLEIAQKITSSTFLESPAANNAANGNVTLNFTIYAMGVGESNVIHPSASRYDVRMDMIDTETGALLLSERHASSYPFGRLGMNTSPPTSESLYAFYKAVNDANNHFIRAMRDTNIQPTTPSAGRINGTLRSVTAEIITTDETIEWHRKRTSGHSLDSEAKLIINRARSNLPAAVYEELRKKQLFDYSPENLYDISITITGLKATWETLLSKRSDAFSATVRIKKNGNLLHTFTIDPTMYPKHSLFEDIGKVIATKASTQLEPLRAQ
ncbi:MAG TPA: hypothetical protein VE028_09740 [Nitratidesulfovibrio sp.]|nr:hypothetical protein [Nitratidesulfovibrio sp.]